MAPEWILLVIIMAGIVAYAVLGGADFGAGVWEFNTAMRSADYEKRLIYQAIGPVWEANHVWLIFAIVGMFSGFPRAFGLISEALIIPLLLGLTGITFRGAAYAFRSYAPTVEQRRGWEVLFALASVAAPLFLGMSAGAIAEGSIATDDDLRFQGSYLTGWMSPFSILCGFFAVGMCAYLAAVFLCREAVVQQLSALADKWRRRALATGVTTGILAMVTLLIGIVSVESLREGFTSRAWPMVAVSFGAGCLSIGLIHSRRFGLATLSASVTVAAVIIGWGLAQFPDLVPGVISVARAKAPENVLVAYLITIAVGAVILVPSMGFLFYLFKFSEEQRPDGQ